MSVLHFTQDILSVRLNIFDRYAIIHTYTCTTYIGHQQPSEIRANRFCMAQ